MYCPQCGQQQVSAELRFCSRCGFPLGGVMELLSNGGLIPQYQSSGTESKPTVSPRRKGVQQGVALIFLAAVLTPLFAVLHEYLGFPELFIALTAIVGFIGGPLRLLYAAIFEEGAQKIVYLNQHHPQPGLPAFQQPAARAVGDINRGRALPPPQQQAAPVQQNWRRPDTAELLHPPSVTENTTRLLDKKEEPSEE